MRHVFIIGSRGLPAKYGGFETFVEKLVENKVSSQLQYHVACLSDDEASHHLITREWIASQSRLLS